MTPRTVVVLVADTTRECSAPGQNPDSRTLRSLRRASLPTASKSRSLP